MEKLVLDACCGSRMMWFDKTNPLVTFMDIRSEASELCDGRQLIVKPDVVADFRNMPFGDNTFKLVVFDPPHYDNLGPNSWLAKKYGRLGPTWRDDLKTGFAECMRVTQQNGIVIFKWNEHRIKLNEILTVIGHAPLFGHTSGRQSKTIWMAFIKP